MRLPLLGSLALALPLLLALSDRADAAEFREPDFLSRTRQLTLEGRRAGEGYWSPDGQQLVFQSERVEGNPFYQIFSLDLTNGESRQISPGQGKTTCAFFHPTEARILYASTHLDPQAVTKQREELELRASGKERRYAWDYDENFDLFAHDLATGVDARLTTTRGYDAEGSYSPDGKWIAYTSTRHAFTTELSAADSERLQSDASYFAEIWRMPAEGGEAVRLTQVPGYDGGPFFSPDGSRIVWRRFDEAGLIANIYTMALDGSDVRQITDFACMSWAPYFHPSGEYLFFAANKEGFANFEIYIVDGKGEKEPVRVTWTDRFDGLPVPSPDGTRLAFTSSRKSDSVGGGAQIFLSQWNHENALRALAEAPARKAKSSESR